MNVPLPIIKEDSLKKRYFFKLFSNIIGFSFSIITQAIVPRGLGPKAYGIFNYLTSFTAQLLGFLDMGTSLAFYTKLSQRQKEFGIIGFYRMYCVAVVLVVIAIVAVCLNSGLYKVILPGQLPFFICLASIFGVLTWITGILNSSGDAFGITVSIEVFKVLQKIISLILIAGLFVSSALTLSNYFYYQFAVTILLGLGIIFILNKKGRSVFRNEWLTDKQIKEYGKEFYFFTYPLFTYSLVSMVAQMADRWFLQKINGSVEQGYFGFSQQIGSICFLFTSALTPLLMREMSVACSRNDLAKAASLFRKYIPLLYSIAAAISCFAVVWAADIIKVMGGDKYKGATLAMSMMVFYPVHQTYGQLSGSVFFASNQTKLYRNIGISMMLLGLPLAFIFIAPAQFGGLHAGAAGLALKTIIIQFIGVNIQLYFNSKFLNLNVWKYIAHQFIVVALLLGLNFVVKICLSTIQFVGLFILVKLFLAVIIYVIVVSIMIWLFPFTFGITRLDIRNTFNQFIWSINNINNSFANRMPL